MLWSLANPIAMTVVYAAIFGHTFISYYGGSLERYAFAVFIGLTVIGFFSATTSEALTSVVADGALLNKLNVPKTAFPIASVLANSFQLCVGMLPILIGIGIASGAGLQLLWLPLPLIALVAFCCGAGLLLSALYVFYRDIPSMWELLTFFVWVTSAVFYPLAIVPKRIAHIVEYNPLFAFVTTLREIAMGSAQPDLRLLGIGSLEGLGALLVGIVVFRAAQPGFMDRL